MPDHERGTTPPEQAPRKTEMYYVIIAAAHGLIAALVLALLFACIFVLPDLMRPRKKGGTVRCASNLHRIAEAMNLYRDRFGGTSMSAVPADTFRGDCWLASLYWTGLITEPGVFLCPGSEDDGAIAKRRPADLGADAVPADAVSYASLCRGLTGARSHRNTRWFTTSAISPASALACDDNEGGPHHTGGLNVVYFDSHREFREGEPAETYDLVGAKGSPYQHLDSGEDWSALPTRNPGLIPASRGGLICDARNRRARPTAARSVRSIGLVFV